MKMLLKLLLVLLVIPGVASAQHKKHQKKAAYSQAVEDSIFRKHFECFYSAKYTAAQRNALYPFNRAIKIQLISFRSTYERTTEAYTPDYTNAMYTLTADSSYKINQVRLVKSLLLDKAGVDSLTDLLYNYGYTPVRKTNSNLINEPTGCYDPRNAILFIGEDGKVIEWLEYCFTCSGYRKSSRKIAGYDFCDEKYEMLRKFFFDRGLTSITRTGD